MTLRAGARTDEAWDGRPPSPGRRALRPLRVLLLGVLVVATSLAGPGGEALGDALGEGVGGAGPRVRPGLRGGRR